MGKKSNTVGSGTCAPPKILKFFQVMVKRGKDNEIEEAWANFCDHKNNVYIIGLEDITRIMDVVRPLPLRWAIYRSADNSVVSKHSRKYVALTQKDKLQEKNPTVGYYIKDLLEE